MFMQENRGHPKLAALALAGVVLLAGCAGWRGRHFDMGQLRDDRAADIDHRLSTAGPAVKNPFGGTADE